MGRGGEEIAIARAMPTRAFCPPESWCGKAIQQFDWQIDLARSSSQRARSAALPLMSPKPQDGVRNGTRRTEPGIETIRRILKHHLDALAHRRMGKLDWLEFRQYSRH